MVKGELIFHDTPEEYSPGCPNCESEKVEWAEIINGTFWKQCGSCGMVYVAHDINQKEIDG